MYAIKESSTEGMLDEALLRIVPHIFGDHSLCTASTWCTYKDNPSSFQYVSPLLP